MERDNIDSYLKRNLKIGPMIGFYWLSLPDEHLSSTQKEHGQCGPFHIGVEVERDLVRFELLVRSETNLHCSCIAYATAAQRQFIFDFIDIMLEEEHIRA